MGESNHNAFEVRWDGTQWTAACFEKYCDNGETCMQKYFQNHTIEALIKR